MKTLLLVSLSALLASAVDVSAAQDVARSESKQYKLITRKPIRSIPLYEIEETHVLSDQAIIVQSGPSRGFLLTLVRPCQGLTMGEAIVITNTAGSVEAGFDSIITGETREHCPIDKIYPLASRQDIKEAESND